MKPWILIDTAAIPGGGELRLLRRDTEFSMRLAETELMGSRVRGSEEALARLGCSALGVTGRKRVLIGGLGMGFTLRAVLDLLGADGTVVVAELIPAVVAWGRGPLAALSGNSLSDGRVTIVVEDVGVTLRREQGRFDAILLDVDNGPAALTRDANAGLYRLDGLAAARAALRPGGVLAVWSAAPDPVFTPRLQKLGFLVKEHRVKAHGTRGARHMIWTATRPDRPTPPP